MSGLINVALRGDETEYTPACGCGWIGNVNSAIEWAELEILAHFEKAHRAEEAA